MRVGNRIPSLRSIIVLTLIGTTPFSLAQTGVPFAEANVEEKEDERTPLEDSIEELKQFLGTPEYVTTVFLGALSKTPRIKEALKHAYLKKPKRGVGVRWGGEEELPMIEWPEESSEVITHWLENLLTTKMGLEVYARVNHHLSEFELELQITPPADPSFPWQMVFLPKLGRGAQ